MGKRSSVFFETDLRAAAETAAFDMERHGLHPEDVDELAEKIEDVIRDFFAPLHDAEDRLKAAP